MRGGGGGGEEGEVALSWEVSFGYRKFGKFKLVGKSLQIIYFTFIWPILEYADVVLNNCTQYEETELEKNS